MLTKEDFEREILRLIHTAKEDSVEIVSGTLHRALGDYPGKNHRMPQCCQAMYDLMRGDDEVISAPPKGKGAGLTVRYYKKNH